MTPTAIPAEAADWARGHVGKHAAWALPADLGGAQAWRMSSLQGLIDLRITRTDENFRREIYAHRNAIRRLGPSHGPRLLASEPRLRSLLTVQPRAWRVDNTNLQQLPRVHEDAGQLLRVLHESARRTDDARAHAMRATVHYVQRIQAAVDHLSGALTLSQTDAVRRSASLLLEHVQELPTAFCHGTFGPATWEWQGQSQTLSITGFGRSQTMAAVIDLARPALLWVKEPHLRDWFFKGYGRVLSEAELLVLGHASVVASGEDLLHAIQLRDTESIATTAAALRHAVDQSGAALDRGSVTSVNAQDGWS